MAIQRPKISAIIPTWNEQQHVEQAVCSVSAADEIIVVDGGSHDRTCEIASRLPCMLIHAHRGRGIQLQEGARQATGEILLFLHADCWLAQGALEQLRRFTQQRPQQPIFGVFRQRIENLQRRYRWLEYGNEARVKWCKLTYGDQGIFVDRVTYQAVGEFADVPLMEDVILARALARHSRPVVLPGPIHLSPRRWQENGVVNRTVRNWFILAAFYLGVSPERLEKWYG